MIRHYFFLFIISAFFVISKTAQAQSPYFNSFKSNTASGIILGGDAKLTSGAEDPANNGYLRLTPSQQDKRGYAYIDNPFPSLAGIKVEFEFFTWGGNVADGITFFLFDPVAGFEIGQYGGALGYAQNKNDGSGLGMKNGFLALGLDEYGNFGAASETKSGGFKKDNGTVYTTPISANGLVVVRGGVGPGGEREGPTAYPFLGGKITGNLYNGTPAAWPADVLPDADKFGIYTNARAPLETQGEYRKARLDIKRVPGTGYVINAEIFVGSKGRWIKVLEDFTYSIADNKIPTTLKAGFSASTGYQYNNHEIRNVLITPSAAELLKPVAVNDAAVTSTNQTKDVIVLVNDNAAVNTNGTFQTGTLDLDPSTYAIENTKQIAGGTFNANADGSVTFIPTNGFAGNAVINYCFRDNYGITSNAATLTLTVSAVNAPPEVALIAKNGIEDNTITFTATDFTANYTDLESNALTKIKFSSLPLNGTMKLSGVNITANQEIPLNQLGNITFVPDLNWKGNTTFNWNAHDGNNYALMPATVSITLSGVNDKPIVDVITKNGTEDTPISFSSLDFTQKFTDPDNDALTKIKITSLPPTGLLKLNGVNVTVNQEIAFADLGNISFVPDANWNSSTSFFYNGSDAATYADLAERIVINITAVNDIPVVSNFNKSGLENTILTFLATDFSSKFIDADNQALTKIQVISLPANGTLKLNGTPVVINQEILVADLGNLSFTPTANWDGSTSFNWNGTDGSSYAALNALVNITISAVNDAPTVANFGKTGFEDTPFSFTALDFTAKFTDPENILLAKIKIISLPANGTLKLSGVNITANQEIVTAQLGDITFTPNLNWNGNTTFSWNGSEGTNYAITPASVIIDITPVNDLPTVAPFSKSGAEDTPVNFAASDFSTKFSDSDNNTLNKIKIISLPLNGTLKLSGTDIGINQEIPNAQLGDITFLPTVNWNGNTSFEWNGNDATSYATLSAVISITITPVNDAPAVTGISKTGTEDTPILFTALDFTQKFSDSENDALSKIKITTLPPAITGGFILNGTAITEGQEIPAGELANISFIPALNWNGSTTFKWTGSDGNSYAAAPALSDIIISAVTDAPTAINDSQETDLNKPVVVTVLNNDFADGLGIDNTSISIVSNPLHGKVIVLPDGSISYIPNDKFAGTDSFTYKVKDSNGTWSNVATVSIIVKGLVMSNVFTPNGDGKNDTFVILGIENYDVADLTVFNRWGNEVYRNSQYTNNWDGSGLNPGTYYFLVKLKKGGSEDVRKGWVLLKR